MTPSVRDEKEQAFVKKDPTGENRPWKNTKNPRIDENVYIQQGGSSLLRVKWHTSGNILI